MLGISGTELVIILFFGFLIFGPEKLPQMGRTVGRAIRQFRTASEAANKKFKEEVADPFQDAIAPYKDQVEQSAAPLKDDIEAINSTFNETKNMITDPFKDMFKPSSSEPAKAAAGTVIAGGMAAESVAKAASQPASQEAEASAAVASIGEDPFAEVFASESVEVSAAKPEAKPIPENSGTVAVKKSMASSLYGLDSAEEDGE